MATLFDAIQIAVTRRPGHTKWQIGSWLQQSHAGRDARHPRLHAESREPWVHNQFGLSELAFESLGADLIRFGGTGHTVPVPDEAITSELLRFRHQLAYLRL